MPGTSLIQYLEYKSRNLNRKNLFSMIYTFFVYVQYLFNTK